jgi:predicted nucleic acid-binding protein
VILIDTNILVDVLQDDPQWAGWSGAQLAHWAATGPLAINAIVYAELAPLFDEPSALDRVLSTLDIRMEDMPREALFLAGKAHYVYRRRGGTRQGVLSDFLIGAHARVLHVPLLTHDARRYRHDFPGLVLLTPDSD